MSQPMSQPKCELVCICHELGWKFVAHGQGVINIIFRIAVRIVVTYAFTFIVKLFFLPFVQIKNLTEFLYITCAF